MKTMKASSNIKTCPKNTVPNRKTGNKVLHPLKKSKIYPQQNGNKPREDSVCTTNQTMVSSSNTNTTTQQH
jgi:hypothetical protein